jgi:hypothetical protein
MYTRYFIYVIIGVPKETPLKPRTAEAVLVRFYEPLRKEMKKRTNVISIQLNG